MLTYDDKLKRAMKWTCFGVIAFFIALVLMDSANARELPEIVEPLDLSSTWDGRRVTIFGYARSCEALQGRLGSNYIKCWVGTSLGNVAVYTDFQLYGVVGERVIVIGVYKESGRFGGFLAEDNFIVADTFIRDWE